MIFLSASVPDPKRSGEYSQPGNINAIRDAIVAFTTVCAEWKIPFYFGGHPAISPLVYSIASKFSEQPNIRIYQSEIFKGKTPKEVQYFQKISWTKAIEGDAKKNVNFMRKQMFEENKNTTMAIFIGGMNGIDVEADMIKKIIPDVRLIPLASTGGAAFDLYERLGCTEDEYLNSYAYLSLFAKLLNKYKNK